MHKYHSFDRVLSPPAPSPLPEVIQSPLIETAEEDEREEKYEEEDNLMGVGLCSKPPSALSSRGYSRVSLSFQNVFIFLYSSSDIFHIMMKPSALGQQNKFP